MVKQLVYVVLSKLWRWFRLDKLDYRKREDSLPLRGLFIFSYLGWIHLRLLMLYERYNRLNVMFIMTKINSWYSGFVKVCSQKRKTQIIDGEDSPPLHSSVALMKGEDSLPSRVDGHRLCYLGWKNHLELPMPALHLRLCYMSDRSDPIDSA